MPTKLSIFSQCGMQHIDYIKQCIQIAEGGKGWVNPNPMVGSLLVHDGEIIGKGFHERYGGWHAERIAIHSVEQKELLQDATLYVSLEPCSHHGKTPPCADLIIESGIKKVVVAMLDPNPLVSGRGIQKLQAAGIEVLMGVLGEESTRLNRFFVCYHQKKRPYFIAKWAETANRLMAPLPKATAFISGEDSRTITHQLRQEVMAVLVGIGTWQTDFPQLNDRIFGGPQPIRVVLDPKNQGDYLQAEQSELITWVLTEEVQERKGNVYVWALGNYSNDATVVSRFLYEKQINSVLVEGGSATLNQFMQENLIDEIHVFQHHHLVWEKGLPAPEIHHHKLIKKQTLQQSDWMVYET